MFQRLATAFLLRRVLRDLTRIGDALSAQTVILARLADRYAPRDPPTERAEVKADTGVSYLNPDEQAMALDYVERTVRDTGHMPDEDEILIHLSDEKTLDLHARLSAREGELARLAEDRA